MNLWGKRFKLPQLTHESFLTLHHSCKIFSWYLPNWASTDLWCVVLYVAYSTTHQRLVEVQFGRFKKNILQEWCRVKKFSWVSCGSLKRFPHTFTNSMYSAHKYYVPKKAQNCWINQSGPYTRHVLISWQSPCDKVLRWCFFMK